MLDRSRLRSEAAQAAQQQVRASAREQFFKALDGLRLGHKRTVIMKLVDGDGHYSREGQTGIQLSALAAEVWKLAGPLSPELRSFSNWEGSRDSGHQVNGFELSFEWPDEAKQQQLFREIEKPGIREICDAITAGIAVSQGKAKTELAKVQTRCEEMAHKGHNSAAVMSLQPLVDFSYPAGTPAYGAKLNPEWLGLAASLVWQALAADEDKPTLVPIGGVGQGSWYNIVVSW